MTPSGNFGPRVSRRTFLTATSVGIGGLALTACSKTTSTTPGTTAASVEQSAILAAEAKRPHTGRTVTANLTPQMTELDLGGPTVRSYAYGDTVPGQVIRAGVGDELAVTVDNKMSDPTSVHWHGIALRNDMDGAAPASPDIKPGESFTYRFSVPHSGTFWAHPHVGGQTDYGLYAPVIVDDPNEPLSYDAEWIVVLDDWTDGVGRSPQQILDELREGGMGSMDHGSMPGMSMPGMSGMPGMSSGMSSGMSGMAQPPTSGLSDGTSDNLLGGDAGDVTYPLYLINGRVPESPSSFTAKPGQRIRIRIINTGADTAFRVALAGHRMTVTHTDGFPVVPTEVDALLVGMSERYDVIVTAADGVFPLVAAAEGKNAQTRALLRTGAGAVPDPGMRPTELAGQVGTVHSFSATGEVMLPQGPPDVNLTADLGGDMMSYQWTINGRMFDQMEPLTVREGQHARLTFTNMSMMWHPMHLHGHTFQVVRADGTPGPRKDTVIVLPMQKIEVNLVADNPGYWMLHCHNGYHQDAGMMTRLDYRS
ncbi:MULTISPECIES: multicopper oxidase family protein [Mycobacteriales]|uniref:multicopper oxidase family protein n=1 Tax=Mycobacteriales TaxID=85007 RepID=UPI00057557A4|nr:MULTISPECIES: multicopper oxidase family protein [Mycobacteriales]KHJ71772.1 oxidase [Rhodococcus sp. Chr-9]MBX4170854.1 multicopper oxidase family protein [Rhodococcus sp. DMU2021]MDJ0401503.1 multicopper oxidase family protein [Rhodococcus rhodochrous]QXF84225.1 multicopper oxidase family protein [Rhodococcus pyridinivorans]UTM39953.1 multicopper oxidase family protein [Rhodococcus pyridinivorans]